jgi:hypothetical protein
MSDSAPVTWFTEDPTTLLIAGGITLVVLLGFFFKTGRGVLLLAMAGVAGLMLLAVVIDRIIVTDREAVENIIYKCAALAEENRLNELKEFISPTATAVRREADQWIGRAKLEAVYITAMRVDLNRQANPPAAQAVLHVIARGSLNDRNMPVAGGYNGTVTVDFEKQGDRWWVNGVQHEP